MKLHPGAELRAKRMAALAEAARSVPINFALVGVQKAATTSYYSMLTKHPEIAGGPEKEITLFIKENKDWDNPDFSDYRRPAKNRERLAGDATPAYLFWPRSLQRMRDYDPNLKLMAIFRDPIERGFSQWSMEKARRPRYPDLTDSIDRFGSVPFPESVPEDGRLRWFRRRTLFARGLYGAQLERGFALFDRSQWLLLEMRAMMRDHHTALNTTTDFLGVERFTEYPTLAHSNASPQTHAGPAPSVAQIEGLVEYFASDLAKFEQLSGLDTSAWPTRQVVDGTLSVADFHAKLVGRLGLG